MSASQMSARVTSELKNAHKFWKAYHNVSERGQKMIKTSKYVKNSYRDKMIHIVNILTEAVSSWDKILANPTLSSGRSE